MMQKNVRLPLNLQPKVDRENIFNVKEAQAKESSSLYGRPAFFLKQSDSIVDDILKEVLSKTFQTKNMIQLYYFNDEDSADLDGSMVYGGFNMIPLYSKIIHIPSAWFKEAKMEPRSGDLLYIPSNLQEEFLFEIVKDPIKEQDRENNTNNGRRFAYKLFLKLYSHDRGNVDFEGDILELGDGVEEDLADLEALMNTLEEPGKQISPQMKSRDEKITRMKVAESKINNRFDNLE